MHTYFFVYVCAYLLSMHPIMFGIFLTFSNANLMQPQICQNPPLQGM